MRLRCHASMAVLLVLAPAAADQFRTDAEPCPTPPTVRQLSPDTARLAQAAGVRGSTDRLSVAIEVVFRLYRHEGSGVALVSPQSNRLLASAYSRGGDCCWRRRTTRMRRRRRRCNWTWRSSERRRARGGATCGTRGRPTSWRRSGRTPSLRAASGSCSGATSRCLSENPSGRKMQLRGGEAPLKACGRIADGARTSGRSAGCGTAMPRRDRRCQGRLSSQHFSS